MQGIHIQKNQHRGKNTVERHYHKVHQILYVLENEGQITFDDQQDDFHQDSLAFITPYSQHSIISNEKMTVLVLEFTLEKLDPNIKDILYQYSFKQSKLLKLNVWEAGDVRKLLRRMLYEQTQGDAINIVAMRVYLMELLIILMRHKNKSNIADANALRAERLKKYIDTHYFEIIDSNHISQKLKISTRHVNSIFGSHFSMTPMKYLNQVRMEAAKKLLIETDKDIASICFEVGFEAISTFYRRFKDYTNLSPNKYRLKYNYHQLK